MYLHTLIEDGWSWASGYSRDRGYFAEAWRDLPEPKYVDGNWVYRECKIELAKTVREAETKLLKRINNEKCP